MYNLHLDHVSQEARKKGFKLVLERMAQRKTSDPVFVTGDFNAGETNPAMTQVNGLTYSVKAAPEASPKTVRLVDTFRVVHPEVKTVGTFNGFKGTAGLIKIVARNRQPRRGFPIDVRRPGLHGHGGHLHARR